MILAWRNFPRNTLGQTSEIVFLKSIWKGFHENTLSQTPKFWKIFPGFANRGQGKKSLGIQPSYANIGHFSLSDFQVEWVHFKYTDNGSVNTCILLFKGEIGKLNREF